MKLKVVFSTITGIAILASVGYLQGQMDPNAPPAPRGFQQRSGHPGPMTPEQRLDRLSQELNLTDQQRTNVMAVFEQMRQQIQNAYLEAKTNAETQLQQILSPQQYQQLQTMWQHHERRWQQGAGHGAEENPETNAVPENR